MFEFLRNGGTLPRNNAGRDRNSSSVIVNNMDGLL
jgi:hypothetical protein